MIVLGSCDVGRQRVRSAGASESSTKEPTYFGGCTSVFVQTELMVGDLSIHRHFIIFMPLVRFVWFCMILYVLVQSVQSKLEQNMPCHSARAFQSGFEAAIDSDQDLRPKPADCDVVTLIWRWQKFLDVFGALFFISVLWLMATFFQFFLVFAWMLVSPIGFQVPRATCYSCGFACELFSAGDFGVRTPWQTKWLEQVEPCRTCLTHCNLMSSRWWTWSPWIREFY